jgi:hypothetical protein
MSSGWRAEDSRNLPPISAMPIDAPKAPKPTMMPQASATRPRMFSMIAPKKYRKEKDKEKKNRSV